MKFPGLATLVIHTKNPSYWIGTIATDEIEAADADVPYVLRIDFCGTRRQRALDILDTSGAVWSGIRHEDEMNIGGPVAMTVRSTVPDDALVAYSMGICPKIPLPVSVLAYMHNVEFNVPHLYALSEDDGFVATMMLDTDSGIFIRYSNQWHEIVDEDVVDGLNVSEVNDASLAMFDQYDNAGQLVALTSFINAQGEPVEGPRFAAPVTTSTSISAAVAATTAAGISADVRDVPRLLSRDDVADAITAAVANPELQWWVSRRVKALGFSDVTLPWEL